MNRYLVFGFTLMFALLAAAVLAHLGAVVAQHYQNEKELAMYYSRMLDSDLCLAAHNLQLAQIRYQCALAAKHLQVPAWQRAMHSIVREEAEHFWLCRPNDVACHLFWHDMVRQTPWVAAIVLFLVVLAMRICPWARPTTAKSTGFRLGDEQTWVRYAAEQLKSFGEDDKIA